MFFNWNPLQKRDNMFSIGKWTAVRLKVWLKQNKLPLIFLLLWFFVGFAVFYPNHGIKAVEYAFYIRPLNPASEVHELFAGFYSNYGVILIIPALLSLFLYNLLEKYRPEIGCRLMAKEMKNHVVVLGYSELGRRIIQTFRENHVPFVLVEPNAALIDEMLREGEPVIVDRIEDTDALTDARVQHAKAVIVASNNPNSAILLTKRVRDLNQNCTLIVRCAQDDLTEALETLGANMVISSSKKDADDIARFIMRRSEIENMTQLSIVTKNRVGLLSEITELLGNAGINIESVDVEGTRENVIVRILTNNERKARGLLVDNGYRVLESEVMVLRIKDRPGELAKFARQMAAGNIKIETIYMLGKEGGEGILAVKVDKPAEAKTLLENAAKKV